MKHHQETIFSTGERIVIIALMAIALILGVLGYATAFSNQAQAYTYSDLLYAAFGLYVLEFQLDAGTKLPLTLDIARWLAPATLSYAAVKTILSFMRDRLMRWKIQRLRNHAIIFGHSEEVMQTVESMHTNKIDTVIVVPPNARRVTTYSKRHIHQLFLEPRDERALEIANLKKAKFLLAATGNDEINLEITYRAYEHHQSKTSRQSLTSVISIDDPELANALYDQPAFQQDFDNFSARILSFGQLAARQLFCRYGPERFIPNLLEQTTALRVLVVGSHPFLENLLLRLAALGHYGPTEKPKVLLIGKLAVQRLGALSRVYPDINQILDVDIATEGALAPNQNAEQPIKQFAPQIIYVCAGQEETTLTWITALSKMELNTPIIAMELTSNYMFQVLSKTFKRENSIHFINLHELTCNFQQVFNEDNENLAKAIHTHYVNQQNALGVTTKENSSLVTWKHLPEILKDANRNQADHLLIKQRLLLGDDCFDAVKFDEALNTHLEQLARVEHDRWIAEKLLSGWRYTSGPKDATRRLSPAIVPWSALSEAEKQKDRDTVLNIPKLLSQISAIKNK